jgi:hypothetical protein
MINFKKFIEELGGTTTGSVAGAGDDTSTIVMRKKYDRKNKRKDMEKVIKRLTQKDSA